MSSIKHVHNLIIGAGLSGLSFAYFSKDDDYLILEKDSTPGGYCRTIPNDRYVWDYAGHFYHFQHEKYKKLFESLVEPDQIVQEVKNTKIYYKGRLVDYPFQMNIHQLEKSEFIDCLYDLYTKDSDFNYHNFLEMLYTKFGKSITEKFLKPYNEKLYAVDLTSLDKDAMGRFFPYADFDAIIRNMKESSDNSYNNTFLYLKKGTGYFIDKLYAELDASKVRFNTTVSSIDRAHHQLTTSAGEVISYDNLINTIPYNEFLKLLNSPDATSLANSLSYNKVLVLNLGFDRPSPKYTSEHWVYFPDKTLNFYRIGFYNNLLNQPELSVYVEIGFPKDAKNIDVDKEVAATLDGMRRVGIIDENTELIDKSIILMDPAYVHISTDQSKAVSDIMEKMENEDIFSLGRYGRWTYNSMEDCMNLADDLASKLNQVVAHDQK